MDVTSLKTHLGDELFAQVEPKLKGVEGLTIITTNDGSWVPKSRLDEELGKIKDHKTTISTLTKQLEEAKKAGDSAATLQATIDSLNQQLKDRDATITGMKRSSKLLEKATKANAKDPALVVRLLDQSKIGEDDKGNITGVDEQLKSMKESSAYLFNEEGGRRAGFGGGKDPASGGSGSGGNSNSDVNAAIRAAAGRTFE